MYVLEIKGELRRGNRVVETFLLRDDGEAISETLVKARQSVAGAFESCFAAALAGEQRSLFGNSEGQSL